MDDSIAEMDTRSEVELLRGTIGCWHTHANPVAYADEYHILVYRCTDCGEEFEDIHCIDGGADCGYQSA